MIPDIARELDRQLIEQRASADALATRAGLMIAATAALIGFSASAGKITASSPVGYWMIGVASVLGVAVFWMARVGIGPSLSVIAQLQDPDMLTNSKLILVEANAAVLTRTQVIFTLQVGLTIAGITFLAISLWPVP